MESFNVTSVASAFLDQKRAIEDQRKDLLDMVREAQDSPEGLDRLRKQLLEAGLTSRDWDDLVVASGVQADGDSNETMSKLMQSVDMLAAEGAAIASGKSTESMDAILDQIGQQVVRLASQTTGRVDSLAEKVDNDRETVAQMEADARAQGVGLSLSREELLANFAEINQELAQPLTATSAVIDMLGGGQLGEVSEAQRDVLKVASDGMDRLAKLVSYLTRISGVPEDLSPDESILNDVYGA
jgi:signal transduction histidine kinase